MEFDVQWAGIGINYNYGAIRLLGDPADFIVNWGDGTKAQRYRGYNRDWDNDGVNETMILEHEFLRSGTIIIKHRVEGMPTMRINVVMGADYDQPFRNAVFSNKDNLIVATGSDDTMRTGIGRDTVSGGDGNDTVDLARGDDTFFGGEGNDMAYGRDGNDYLQGDEGYDLLIGGEGNDYLLGSGGNDTLRGNEGHDRLDGGAGHDQMTGGPGSDVFIFRPDGPWEEPTTEPEGNVVDTIRDFVQGEDYLDTSAWGRMTFIGRSSSFTGAGAEIRYVDLGRGTIVIADVDGDKVEDFRFWIHQSVVLQASDFTGGNIDLAM